MSEQQINEGYARLDAAIAPPLDAVRRVERRAASRRRRRRTALVGVVALGVLAVGGTAVKALSGDDGSGTTVAVDPSSHILVMTRADGSTYTFRDVEVTCDPPAWAEPAGRGPERIWAFSPRLIKGARAVEPFVYFDGIVEKIAGDQTFTFPNEWNMRSDRFPMVLFVADTDGNEAASSAGGESGTVRVAEASCDPVPVLRLEVDMTLGSEVQEQPIRVHGGLG